MESDERSGWNQTEEVSNADLISQSFPVVFIQDEAVVQVIGRHAGLTLRFGLLFLSNHPPQTVGLGRDQSK